MADPTRLSALLGNLEALIVDDKAAAERDRVIREGQAYEARIRRREVLSRERIPLDPRTERAILDGGDALEETRALVTVRAWLARADAPPVLVLSGGTGCGKSAAAAYAVVEHRAGIWRTAPQLCRTFSASFGDQHDDQELCLTASLLVADDIGSELEPHRERMAATLVELLEHRKRSATRTIITTNLDRRAFAQHYGSERLVSRMAREAGVVAWCGVHGPDLRRQR